MDMIVWSRIIAPLAVFIFVVYVVISANRLEKKIRQQKAEAKYQEKSPIVSHSLEPNIVDDYGEFHPLPVNTKKDDVLSKVDEMQKVERKLGKKMKKLLVTDEKTDTPTQISIDSTSRLPLKHNQITTLLDMSHHTVRNGVILSEILGRPKGFRGR